MPQTKEQVFSRFAFNSLYEDLRLFFFSRSSFQKNRIGNHLINSFILGDITFYEFIESLPSNAEVKKIIENIMNDFDEPNRKYLDFANQLDLNIQGRSISKVDFYLRLIEYLAKPNML